MKQKVTIVIGTYLPGVKAGGPVRTIQNLTESLGETYKFRIITYCKDLGEKIPYEGIKPNSWYQVGKAKVFYSRKKNFDMKLLADINAQTDIFFICGCYNIYFIKVLILKMFGIITKPIIVAPMGGVSDGAIQIKGYKKSIYWKLLRYSGILNNINWSVTDKNEKKSLVKMINGSENIFIAQDLVRKYDVASLDKNKEKGRIKVVFLSRISREKNLLYALNIVRRLQGKVIFDIYGPMEDEDYWIQCKHQIDSLPKNINVRYRGAVAFDKSVEVFCGYQLFLFPTMSENFGHVIYESLAGGCPVIISDQTPWTNEFLKHGGRAIPLRNEDEYVQNMQKFVDMDQIEYDVHMNSALKCAEMVLQNQRECNEYLTMFNKILADTR